MIHLMIDAHANGDDPMKALDKAVKNVGAQFASEREEFREMVDSVRYIMADYFEMDWGDKDLQYIRKKGKSAEHEFEIDLVDGILLTGKLDGLAITPSNGNRWLVENKSFSRMPSEDHRWRNVQGNIYHYVVEKLGIPKLAGLCWNYIRTKPPSVPQILKTGLPSQKRLDTLPSRLIEFMKDHAVEKKDMKRILDTAEKNRDQYFIRIFSPLRPKIVKRVTEDFIAEALVMAEHEGKWKTKTISRGCEWCEYEPVCRAELTGADPEFIRKKEYYHSGDEDAPIEIGG